MPFRFALLLAVGLMLIVFASGALLAFGLAATTVAVVIVIVVLPVLTVLAILWLLTGWHRIPTLFLGVPSAPNVPAIPVRIVDLPDTASRLFNRKSQMEQAVNGLSTRHEIAGLKGNAYTFMGMKDIDPLQRALRPHARLSFDAPEKYSMAWTTVWDIHADAQPRLREFADSISLAGEATRQFWKTISAHGMPYNLIVLKRVAPADPSVKDSLGGAWTPKMESVWQADNLYVIDMTFFTQFGPATVNFFTRFTPGTLTLLERDPSTKDLRPFAVRVNDVQYEEGDPAWLYALQAAKTSITVWGIWLGHVYQWHIVPGAMQMTMFRHLPEKHPVRQLFGTQSDYMIAFDVFLMLTWPFIAPPTSVDSPRSYLLMLDAFAAGRNFFDDDPYETLNRLGLRDADFTDSQRWDRYPLVSYFLDIYDATAEYVRKVVEAFYPDDLSVAADAPLQVWINASGSTRGGNVQGLPALDSRDALKKLMTSLIYRITVHGAAHLRQSANPVLSFAPNFPPCLQSANIPAKETPVEFKTGPTSPPDAISLADFLPNTGTVGDLTKFLYAFSFSTPYEPFIPLEGEGENLYFDAPFGIDDACNEALKKYRRDIIDFIDRYAQESGVPGEPAQIHQWDLNIAL